MSTSNSLKLFEYETDSVVAELEAETKQEEAELMVYDESGPLSRQTDAFNRENSEDEAITELSSALELSDLSIDSVNSEAQQTKEQASDQKIATESEELSLSRILALSKKSNGIVDRVCFAKSPAQDSEKKVEQTAEEQSSLNEEQILEIIDQDESLEIVECEGIDNATNKTCLEEIAMQNALHVEITAESTPLSQTDLRSATSEQIDSSSDTTDSVEESTLRETTIHLTEEADEIPEHTTFLELHKASRGDLEGARYYRSKRSAHIIKNPKNSQFPKPGLSKAERESIEADIVPDHSLVIEENVEDIRSRLMKLWQVRCKNCEDISEDIVILENDNDVENYLNNYQGLKNKKDLRKLLRYFERLFENLPKEALDTFAKSEYFDLYVDFMNQLDSKNNE